MPEAAMNHEPLVDQIAHRLAAVRARIRHAGGDESVVIMGVTKSHPLGVVNAGLAAGLAAIGESYVQEMVAKFAGGVPAGAELHMIGHLQTNKVRHLPAGVAVVAGVDRQTLIDELARRRPGQRILVQVNTTGEPSKSGCPPEQTADLVAAAGAAGLYVDGLMTIGPTDGDPAVARRGFAALRRMVDELGLGVCSMGMSDDLEVAIGEGSTQVRIGTSLFGVRPPRTSVG